MYPINTIRFIGPQNAEKLQKVGIHSHEDLLRLWGDETQRPMLAERSGISENLFEKWFRMVDFLRVKGMTPEYVDLLDRAGIHSVKTLCEANPSELFTKLSDVKSNVPYDVTLPTVSEIKVWQDLGRSLEVVGTRTAAVST